jgi:hypothetical protein
LNFLNRCVLGAAILLAATGSVPAQTDPDVVSDVDRPTIERRLGESEQIKKRHDWFFSSRTAGAANADERARLRREAVLEAKSTLEAQAKARSEGRMAVENPWAPKGPTPSNFGNWTFGTVSGRVTALAGDWSGGILYLGTAAGGLWKSVDDGQNWEQLFDDVGTMAIGAVAVDPNDPNVLWAGTGDNLVGCESYFGLGLYRSPDGGQTWEARNGSGSNTLDNLATFADVIVDPRDSNHLVVGGRIRQCGDGSGFEGGIYTSTDGGLNWTARIASKQIYEIKQDPTVMDTFWAATDDGIYKSTDNAETWAQQTASGLPAGGVGRCELAIAPSASNTVYALFASGPALWRTTDGGTTWTLQTSGSNACDGQCSYNMVLRVKVDDPDTVYRGTIRSFKSVNGGLNWTDLTGGWGSGQKVHQDTHVMVMDPNDPLTYYTGTDGGLWKSTNGGTSFTNLNGNVNSFLFYAVGVDAQDPDRICGGAQDNSSVARSSNNVWSLQAVTGDGFTCHIDPQNGNYSYITSYPSSGYPNVWRSSGGLFGGYGDISGSGSGIVQNDRINWVTPYLLDPQTPTTLYLGTHRIYRSDDRGSSWALMSPDLTNNSGSLKNIGINRNFPDHLLTASGSGRVWRSTDGALNWTDISSGLPARGVNDVASDPINPDRAFAVVGGFNSGHVWEWTAAGGWIDRSAGLPNVPHNTVLMISDDDIFVGNDIGVYRSLDGGQSWTPYMDGMPLGAVVMDLKYNLLQNIVTAGTYGNGAWQTALGAVAPILFYDSSQAPVEIDGNGNGLVEPGETWGVSVRLRNGGGASAVTPTATVATSAPGITMLDGGVVNFNDIFPGLAGDSVNLAAFTVDPASTCGDTLTFDLVNIVAANDPGPFVDVPDVFSFDIGGFLPPVPFSLIDDNFDPTPDPAWSHQAIDPGFPGCEIPAYRDEWIVISKDAAHGDSYHAGRGPGLTYSRKNFAWLYHGGADSGNGPGLTIPADAVSATLTMNHWYDTASGSDGGTVVIDFLEDDNDNYVAIDPIGGYPGGTLGLGTCNGLGGLPAFQGDSGGWVSSTWDLSQYAGSKVYLAFVFGSDTLPSIDEGWYIDDVYFEYELQGSSVCEVTPWPGTVPQDATFSINGAGTIEAAWGDACNSGLVPGQQYAIHAGDLAALRATGVYDHAPVAATCDRTSPATFGYGSGLEYYLIVPNESVREGSAGVDSQGVDRATPPNVCGEQRIGSCS